MILMLIMRHSLNKFLKKILKNFKTKTLKINLFQKHEIKHEIAFSSSDSNFETLSQFSQRHSQRIIEKCDKKSESDESNFWGKIELSNDSQSEYFDENDDIIDDDIILEESGIEQKKNEGKTINDRHQNYKIQFLKFSEQENLDVTDIIKFTIFSGKDSNNENERVLFPDTC